MAIEKSLIDELTIDSDHFLKRPTPSVDEHASTSYQPDISDDKKNIPYSSLGPLEKMHVYMETDPVILKDMYINATIPAYSPEHFAQKVLYKTVTLGDIDWMARYAAEKVGEDFEHVRKNIINYMGSMASLSEAGRTVADLGSFGAPNKFDIPLREKPAKKIDAHLNEMWGMLSEGVDIEDLLGSKVEDMDQEELRADFMPTDIFPDPLYSLMPASKNIWKK